MKKFRITPLTPIHTLKYAYIMAFCTVAFVLLVTLTVNQFALAREQVSRQAAGILSRQSIRSERIGRDIILLLVPGNHKAVIAEMQRDLNEEDQERRVFSAQYASYYPSFAQLDGGQGHALQAYFRVRTNALAMITIAQESPTQQKRDAAHNRTYATIVFYAQPEQLKNIQDAQAIVDADTDSYIERIREIDILSSVVGVLVLILEGVFVLMPAVRIFDQSARQEDASHLVHPETQSI